MRCTFYVPGLCQYSIVPGHKGVYWRVLFLFFISLSCLIIIGITLSQNSTITRLQAELDSVKYEGLGSIRHRHKQDRQVTVVEPTDRDDNSLNYGILIDCGSSGSRVFVYFWPPHNGEPQHLLNIQQMRDSNSKPVVMKVEPGLDTFADKPSEASDYIAPLLRFSADFIPQHKHLETPVYIMATAGLRMLGPREQDAILNDLRVDLSLHFKFLFSPTWVEVISGKQEGIYSWIAVNYALGKFNHDINGEEKLIAVEINGNKDLHFRKRTVGVVDLGGASLQVAFELPKSTSFPSQQDDSAKNLLAEFSLGCSNTDIDHVYRLYISTFLGFGTNIARARYEEGLAVRHLESSNHSSMLSSAGPTVFLDPCLPVDRLERLSLNNVTITLRGTGNLSACSQAVRPLLNRTECDPHFPCSINGVFQPEIDFLNSEFAGFSEFFYTMEDILLLGGHYDRIHTWKSAEHYCLTNWSAIERWRKESTFPRADFNRYRLQCFKSAWMFLVLHEGLGFPLNYEHLTSTEYVNEQQIHWTLGALLYKTKYFPLREIEKHRNTARHVKLSQDLQHSYLLLSLCTLTVVVAICLYMWRLRSSSPSRLPRVQTMAYYMVDESEVEEGIRFDRSHTYAGFKL